jgi:hypothetical protein
MIDSYLFCDLPRRFSRPVEPDNIGDSAPTPSEGIPCGPLVWISDKTVTPNPHAMPGRGVTAVWPRQEVGHID